MHNFLFTFWLHCQRRYLGWHSFGFDAVLKQKMLAFGSFLQKSLHFWWEKWFSAQTTPFGTPTSTESVGQSCLKLFEKKSNPKSSMVVPWKSHKKRKNSRVFSNFGSFCCFFAPSMRISETPRGSHYLAWVEIGFLRPPETSRGRLCEPHRKTLS